MVYDRWWVFYWNEVKVFDGFIKIDNIEKNKKLFLNKDMIIWKFFIIYVIEKNNNRCNNVKSVIYIMWNGVIMLKSIILWIMFF